MNQAHEDHLHLLVCIDRINSAWQTLKAIQANTGHSLVGPAFRYALVEYATGFTRSDGSIKKRRTLPPIVVPPAHKELHTRIIDARHQTHAHADLVALDAVLHVDYINGIKHVSHVQNYIHGLEELKNLDAIVELIEDVLENVYALHRESKERLLPEA